MSEGLALARNRNNLLILVTAPVLCSAWAAPAQGSTPPRCQSGQMSGR